MRDPLAIPGVVLIPLDAEQSAQLRAVGDCFQIVGRGSYPETPGLMVIYCHSTDPQTSRSACGVILGTHSAKRVPRPSTTKTTTKP